MTTFGFLLQLFRFRGSYNILKAANEELADIAGENKDYRGVRSAPKGTDDGTAPGRI